MTIRLKNITEFKKLLMKNGYTITSFSKATGISRNHISLIMNEKRNPSPEAADKILKMLKVTFDEIFFIKNGN